MYVIFGEDKSKKTEDSAQNISIINKVVLKLLRHYKPEKARGYRKISMI
jgi:hypothetical protein